MVDTNERVTTTLVGVCACLTFTFFFCVCSFVVALLCPPTHPPLARIVFALSVCVCMRVYQVLQELSPQGLHAVFERFRGILHEGQIDKRVQYTIETLFAVRKSGFSDHPAVPPELDLVERDDQITFEMGLEDKLEKEEMLDIFRMDEK